MNIFNKLHCIKIQKPIIGYFLLLFYIILPLKGAATSFPWVFNELQQKQKNIEFHIKTLQFLNENRFRYFTGATVFVKQPVFHINMDYNYSVYENYHYFRPFEFNIRLKRKDGEWIIGRKLELWNKTDYFWNRDLWQPVYTNDALRPKWGGLTGIFRTFKTQDGEATLFGSFIFIPNFTAAFTHEKGKFKSNNSWFISPSIKKLGASNIAPFYVLKSIDWKSFLKLSVAGKISYKNVYLAYAYKPMNNIKIQSSVVLPLNINLTGSSKKGLTIATPLDPVILHHHLVSGGFMAQSKEQTLDYLQYIIYRFKTSFTYSHPDVHVLKKASDIFFQPKKTLHVSAKGEVHIKDSLEETFLHIAYTHKFQPREAKKNNVSLILPRVEKKLFWDNFFQFSRAISTGLEHSIKFNTLQKVNIKLRLIYDLELKYFLSCLYGSVSFNNDLSFFISGDITFSKFPFSLEQISRNDLGMYSNKSRLFGGISYAF